MTCEGDDKMEQLSIKEKEYFNKQLNGFIKEVQERFHLSYEEALREIFSRTSDLLLEYEKIAYKKVKEL